MANTYTQGKYLAFIRVAAFTQLYKTNNFVITAKAGITP
jgi:hypothetical protein